MEGYLTQKCSSCPHWRDNSFEYGCALLDPYSCVYISRTIEEVRLKTNKGDGENAV